MASSNRHWPSMFKSKPCNSTLSHQWQGDPLPNPSLISSPAPNRPPYSSGLGCEERTPEPKPRWNPRPEQIRILEAIFNSGMVNPPRDEIRKIRVQLQEYGQVGDANVFYWFQNRKSRSKHKQRQLQAAAAAKSNPPPSVVPAKSYQPMPSHTAAPNSSSSSSGILSPNSSNEKTHSGGPATPTAAAASVIDYLNSPTGSVNQQAFTQAPSEFQLEEPFFFPVQQSPPAAMSMGQEFFFSGDGSISGGVVDQGVGNCPSFLLSELMLMSGSPSSKIQNEEEHEKMKLDQQIGNDGSAVPNPARPSLPPSFYFPDNRIIQGEPIGPTKAIVFINDVCFEVGVGPFNVREAFGDEAVLIHSSGQPVLTDEWGITLHPLQHGSFYYLLRPFAR